MKFDLLCEEILRLMLEYLVLPYAKKRELKTMIDAALRIQPADRRFEPLQRCRRFLIDTLYEMDYQNLRSRNIQDPETVNKIVEQAIKNLREEDDAYYKISLAYLNVFEPKNTLSPEALRVRKTPVTRQRLF